VLKKISVKLRPHDRVRYGHPWIYKSSILPVKHDLAPGDLVEVTDERRQSLGVGYFNPASEISIRLLSPRVQPIDKNFFKRRIVRALDSRRRFVSGSNAFRVISSEGDGLPGVIVDQYADVLVAQFLTKGADRLKPTVLDALREVFPDKGIYEKSDSASRRLEGLTEQSGWICGNPVEALQVQEGDIRFTIRFDAKGHKTGFYLDQRENRLYLRDVSPAGSHVLDAFCYEGGFALHLAARGCHVLGIEIQEDAVRRAEEHRDRNGLSSESLRFEVGNAFDKLREYSKETAKFDLIILDPPSFVKKKSAVEGALAGYKEIALRAMNLLSEGGLLALFSCSYHVDESLLLQTAMAAAHDTRKGLTLVRTLKQSADHPINPFIPETYYLKGFLFQVFPLIF
jgi:23S rRNA (cytosine1962-C5)-methyltransferase